MSALRLSEIANERLRAGQRLTVVVASGGSAYVDRSQGGVLLDHTVVASGATRVFGEYGIDVELRISCVAGTLAYTQSQNTGPRATQTNDAAGTGEVGELLSTVVEVANAVPETSATPVDVCTLALTPGDWDVSAVLNRALTGVTATQYTAGIALGANTIEPQAGGSGLGSDASVTQNAAFGATVTGAFATSIPPVRLSIAVNTTIHLVAADTFSAGTIGAFGTLRARRVR